MKINYRKLIEELKKEFKQCPNMFQNNLFSQAMIDGLIEYGIMKNLTQDELVELLYMTIPTEMSREEIKECIKE